MKRKIHPVLGHHAPPPRLTFLSLTLVATGLSAGFLLALGLVGLWFN